MKNRTSLIFGLVLTVSGCVGEKFRDMPEGLEAPAFENLPVSAAHQWTEQGSHPFSGAAVIDIDNDGKMEIFIGGGKNQDDMLLSYQAGELVDIIHSTGISDAEASYGATAFDLDNDADTDLIVARDNGVSLYFNHQGVFQKQIIDLDLDADAIPFGVTVADINNDGHVDLYVSNFVGFPEFESATFNNPDHAKKNRMLLNNGDFTFDDITAQTNTYGKQNTFFSTFVDLNQDGLQDLVLAQNTGEVEIYANHGQLKFQRVQIDSGFGYWMGLAIGDIDKDGDQDIYFSNIGNSIPEFLTKGDLHENQRLEHEWLLLRNDGDFNFADVTTEYGLTGFGFAWGAVFEDLNLDGNLDLLVAQNYIKWPIHKLFKLKGKTFLQHTSDGRSGFYQVDALDLLNPDFSQSPLIADIDANGRPDVIWLNIDADIVVGLNTSQENYLKVLVADNLENQGKEVTLVTKDGNSYTRQIIANTGLMTDQTPNLFFGLGNQKENVDVLIRSGENECQQNDVAVNQIITLMNCY